MGGFIYVYQIFLLTSVGTVTSTQGNSDSVGGKEGGKGVGMIGKGKEGNEEKTHWIVKAASVYLWVMFIGDYLYSFDQIIEGFIRFGNFMNIVIFILIDFLPIFLSLFLLTFIVFKPIQKKVIIILARFSPLLPIIIQTIVYDIRYHIFYFFSGYFLFINIFQSKTFVILFQILSIISVALLIVNAWHPIRSKNKEVKG